MAAASQGTYINPMAALATQIPHAALNGNFFPISEIFKINSNLLNVLFNLSSINKYL